MLRPFALLAVLTLAACDPPFEEVWPRQNFAFDRDGQTYDVRVQYDPFERGYYARVALRGGKLRPRDGNVAFAIVEEQLGPELCEGGRLSRAAAGWVRLVDDGPPEEGYGRYLWHFGQWEILAACV